MSSQQIQDEQIHALLGEQGAFAAANDKFHARASQQSMAVAINQAINQSHNLLVEAGTGVGKTFAYLLPALLSQKKLVISTATKNLQDQLCQKDLPAIYQILKISPATALLKGRNNYLCEYRLENTLASARLPNHQAVKDLAVINRWREKTLSGDLSELANFAENSPAIPYVTSTADNCLGKDCPFIDNCFLAAAREKARKASVLVVNHHLLLADLVLKEDGFGELLPDPEIFIIDEVHHLLKTVYQFYGASVSSRQISDLCRELELEYRTQVTDAKDLLLTAQRVAKQVKEFRLALSNEDSKSAWAPAANLVKNFDKLTNKLNKLYDIVKVNSERTKAMQSCYQRLKEIKATLSIFNIKNNTQDVDNKENNLQSVKWIETIKSSFRLHATPLNVASLFQQSRQRYADSSWIMTSATISVNQSFAHFIDALGWQTIKTVTLPTIFDYQKQALMYLPRYLPSVSNPQHTKVMLDTILPLLYQTKGRALLLFTSHKLLKKAAELLKDIDHFNCLVQGEASKAQLLKQFTQQDNSLLLATESFWQGVDIPGNDLILLVIDKLPFESPDDPILSAKIKQCRQNKLNPFMQLQIPQAVLALKQGFGRLIRSESDRGVFCIADPRITGKAYGEIFLKSLPDMQRTRDQQLVTAFIADILNSCENPPENPANHE